MSAQAQVCAKRCPSSTSRMTPSTTLPSPKSSRYASPTPPSGDASVNHSAIRIRLGQRGPRLARRCRRLDLDDDRRESFAHRAPLGCGGSSHGLSTRRPRPRRRHVVSRMARGRDPVIDPRAYATSSSNPIAAPAAAGAVRSSSVNGVARRRDPEQVLGLLDVVGEGGPRGLLEVPRGAPQAARAFLVAVGEGDDRQVVHDQRDAGDVTGLVEVAQRVAARLAGFVPVALAGRREGEHVQRPRLHRPVAGGAMELERTPVPGLGRRRVGGEVVEAAESPQEVSLAALVAEPRDRCSSASSSIALPVVPGLRARAAGHQHRSCRRTPGCTARWRSRPGRPARAGSRALRRTSVRRHRGPTASTRCRRTSRRRCARSSGSSVPAHARHRLEPRAGLVEVAALLPEPPQRERQPCGDRGLRDGRSPSRERRGCCRARVRAGRASAAGPCRTARARARWAISRNAIA